MSSVSARVFVSLLAGWRNADASAGRDLAAMLDVSRTTVTAADIVTAAELHAAGLVTSLRG